MDRSEVERFVRDHPGDVLPPRLRAVEPGDVLDLVMLGGSMGLAVVEAGDGLIVLPVVDRGGVRRAEPGDGVWAAVLDLIAAGDGPGGLSVRRDAEVPDGRCEREIDVDQSNESVVVGDAAVVKLFVRTAPGPQPADRIVAHLRAVGFDETPASFGTVHWLAGDGAALVATAAAFLPGASDGWSWYPDMVAGGLDGSAPWEPTIDAAASMGAVTGRLHGALATPSPVFPSPVGRVEAGAWGDAARRTLDEALALTNGAEGERLRALAPAATDVLERFGSVGETTAMCIHGDLHVGQMLRWDGGLAVSDFDGNPLTPLASRLAPDSPARDVAAMVRAIDHVGRVVQRLRPGNDDAVRRWIASARTAFLDAYRATVPAGVFDERLLVPFEVAQEAHEFVYAARYLPRWLYVPDRAMPDLLEAIR